MEVIGVGEEEEESEPATEADAMEQAERLNDRRVQLAGFLKLVIFGAVEMKVAAPVFAQYVRVSAAADGHQTTFDLCLHLLSTTITSET